MRQPNEYDKIAQMIRKVVFFAFVFLMKAGAVALADETPVVSDAEKVLDGTYARQPISLHCHIRDVFRDDVDDAFIYLLLDCNGSTAYASRETTNATATIRSFQPFLDCDVALNCRVKPTFPYKYGRRLLRQLAYISSTNDITVLRRQATDRFAVRDLGESPLRLQDIHFAGFRKVRGTVVARWRNDTILVRTADDDSTIVQLSEPDLPPLDTTIEAVGTPETDLYHVNLIRAQWRPVDDKPQPAETPRTLSLDKLFTLPRHGGFIINTQLHGSALRIRGVLKNVLVDRDGFRRLLVNDGRFNLPVDCSATPEVLDRLAEGSEIEVSGICVMESESWRPNTVFPKVSGLFLVMRTADDLRVLRTPPWWTPARFLLVLLILLGVIVAILIWNATLRALVARKSRQLLKEQAEKLGETLKIDERTRLAAELHDYLAQNLTTISYQVSAAKSALSLGSSDTEGYLNTVDRMLQSCRTDLRRCLWDLKSDALDEPDLARAILKSAGPVAGDAHLQVRFDVRRALLSDTTAHTILSIVRELVGNAVRHGRAQNVRIAGERRNGRIRFSVRDDGAGFDPARRPGQADGHFGLDGVRERIKHFDGSLEIDSAPGTGTRIVVTLKAGGGE